MAALAYLLPPVTGLVSYFGGRGVRARFHGLQAIAFGTLWPALLWIGSFITPGATQIAVVLGVVAWIVLLGATALGRDPRLPVVGSFLARSAEISPKGAP